MPPRINSSPATSGNASNAAVKRPPDLSKVWKMPLDYFDMHMMLSLSRQSLDPKLRLAMQMLKDNARGQEQRLIYDATRLIEVAFCDPGAQRPWKTVLDEYQFKDESDKYRAKRKLFNVKRDDRIVQRDLFNALAEWILNNGLVKPRTTRRQEILLTYQMDTYALTLHIAFTHDKHGREIVYIKEMSRADYETAGTTRYASATRKIVKEMEAEFELPLRAWRHKLQKLMFT